MVWVLPDNSAGERISRHIDGKTALCWAERASFSGQGAGNGEQEQDPCGTLRADKSAYDVKRRKGDLKVVAPGPLGIADPTTWRNADLKPRVVQESEEFEPKTWQGT